VLEAVRIGLFVIVNVTGTVWAGFPVPTPVTLTVPLYVPAASPVGSTPTAIGFGVVPETGLTVNQFPPVAWGTTL
jgi:hypothetical protein